MERHSVPQNIMDVQFKLFGAFNMKQFGFLAGGFVVSLIIYFLRMPALLKIILIGISASMGLVLAIVKINGQASEVFIKNYIIALFNSQERIWKKTESTPDVLKDTKIAVASLDDQLVKTVNKSSKKQQYIPLVSLSEEEGDKLDDFEKSRLDQIDRHFGFQADKTNSNPVRRNEVKPPTTLINRAFDETLTNPIVSPKQDSIARDASKNPQENVGIVAGEEHAVKMQLTDNIRPNRPINFNDEQKTTIFGKVVNKKGESLEGAEVLIQDDTKKVIRKILTNKNGEIHLKNQIKDGLYMINISLEGFKFSEYQVILNNKNIENFIFSSK